VSTDPHLQRAEFVATLLDDAVELPVVGGVGLDPLLGLLPVAGDTVAAAMGLYIVLEAFLAGVSRRTLARMLVNVGLDWAVGSVPVVGDLFDAWFGANRRNVELFAASLSD
jgi:hypothetical protein